VEYVVVGELPVSVTRELVAVAAVEPILKLNVEQATTVGALFDVYRQKRFRSRNLSRGERPDVI